ncbi:MAG: FkbM family methyltransferase [Thermoanaerobaculia bacterium]|nr:FkbM family methyltransferase [Thermoanaerobaculia bacterium]
MRTLTKLAFAGFASRILRFGRALLGRGPIATVSRGGFRWRLDLAEGIDLSIYLFGAFERKVLRVYDRYVERGSVVLDIGANIGSHTLPLAQRAGASGRVVAMEATDFAMDKLRAHLELNPELAPRVLPLQALLVANESVDSKVRVASSWPLDKGQDLHPLHGGRAMSTRGAELATLDDLLQRHEIEAVDFVKLDTDGSEAAILAGAERLLTRFRPIVLMELAPYCFQPGEFRRMLAILSDHRYHLTDLGGRRRLPLDEPALRARIREGSSINALAMPVEGLPCQLLPRNADETTPASDHSR